MLLEMFVFPQMRNISVRSQRLEWSNGGQAEEWCAEAMIRTATGHLLNNEEQELLVNQAVNKRNAFWMIAMKVAGAVKERTKIRMMLSDAT
ncbi:hypothetical protein N9828_01520 [bacterium]|nr:hypothetical protein [bacterium]